MSDHKPGCPRGDSIEAAARAQYDMVYGHGCWERLEPKWRLEFRLRTAVALAAGVAEMATWERGLGIPEAATTLEAWAKSFGEFKA